MPDNRSFTVKPGETITIVAEPCAERPHVPGYDPGPGSDVTTIMVTGTLAADAAPRSRMDDVLAALDGLSRQLRAQGMVLEWSVRPVDGDLDG